jgi:hypothetical protein
MYGNSNNKSNGNSKSQKGNGYKGNGGKKEEKVFRGPFPSNRMGLPIVNAITGVKYPWNVGSFEEDHLWKVVVCSGIVPMTYFYDSPEQYEAHKMVTIDQESKDAWHALQKNLE